LPSLAIAVTIAIDTREEPKEKVGGKLGEKVV